MEELLKICAVALAGIIIISLIKVYRPEFLTETIICVSVIILWSALDGLKAILIYTDSLYGQITYGKEYFPVIIKVIAISYITEFTASICEDAGEKSIAGKIELAGKIAVFAAALPVFTSLVQLLRSITG